tara:strand:+ start:313 stop:468 length:156 start_codon:yes stop_codon:yes gene_type:complete
MVTPTEGVDYFQLGTYESSQKCNVYLEKAKVMETSINTQVVCIHLGLGQDE